jgi:hypothetical protein
MKRQHRRWHRVIWCLLLPTLVAVVTLGFWLKPPALVNPALPPALENAVIENAAHDMAPIAKPR